MDQAKAEAFAQKLLDAFNGAAMVFLGSVGHRTGLFDVLATLPPSTSDEIATATGLQERYVREWANGLTTARVLDYDPTTKRYSLPPEHAAFLTRAAGQNNFAHMMQYFPLIGRIEDGVIDGFRTGGGVGYEGYPNFQQLQSEETGAVFDETLIPVVLPFAPGLIDRLERGIDVLEIGCGSGHATNLLATTYPNSRFTGADLSEEGISLARKEAAELALTNVEFVVADATSMPGQFDFVAAFDMVHDAAQPAEIMRNVHRALRDGGVFLIGDINASSNPEDNIEHPMGPTLYTFSVFHCMTVSLAQGGVGLGTVWGKQLAERMLRDAGFRHVTVNEVEGDLFHVYYVATK